MPLPSRNNVETLDYSLGAQPALVLEAKSLSSGTLDYSVNGQPVGGAISSGSVVAQNGAFFIFFNGL